jgi:TfoX-like protein
MFGGLAFLIRGNMAVAASGQGGVLVRVDPAESELLVATTNAHLMEMRGRRMPGWLRVGPEDLHTKRQLAELGGTRHDLHPLTPRQAVTNARPGRHETGQTSVGHGPSRTPANALCLVELRGLNP